MKNLSIAALLLFTSFFAQAQVEADDSPTPEECVQALVGEGVIVSNITFNGQPGDVPNDRIGTFTVGELSGMDIDEGVVMGSGGATFINSPNSSGNSAVASMDPSPDSDADLTSVSGEASLNDIAILEFDFIPNGDSVQFEFVFGSDEYNGFVGSFNDVFGIFLSGPGINGPFTDGAENIALIPGTTQPVTINNVNAGNDGNGCTNCEFYVESEGNTDPNAPELDGYTTLLTAALQVECGGSYHLKFAVADVIDNAYDTAVMIRSGSLTSNGVAIDATATIDGQAPFPGDSIIVEGCNTAQFTFFTPDPLLTEADFEILGTAENGVDYDALSGTVNFVNGVGTVLVSAINDNIEEGTETVTFQYTFVNECGEEVVASSTLYIQDYVEPTFTVQDVDITCPGDEAILEAQEPAGLGFVEYTWSQDGAAIGMGPLISVSPPVTTVYEVTNLDFCGTTFTEQVTVTVPNNAPLTQDAIFQEAPCPGNEFVLAAQPQGGYEPYVYTWENVVTGAISNDQTLTVNPNPSDNFTLTVVDACANTVQTSATASQPSPNPVFWDQTIDTWCEGQSQLVEGLAGGFPPITFKVNDPNGPDWLISGSDAQVLTTRPAGIYEVFAVDNCGQFASIAAIIEPCELIYNNVFTPNGDGMNDTFWITNAELFGDDKLTIFDRWGVIIFEKIGYNNDWDGKNEKGNDFPAGTYYYVYDPGSNDNELPTSGFFTIVR